MRVFGFFRKGKTLFVPLNRVRGIFQDEVVFRYRELSDRFYGLVFLSGEVIPVVDINKLLCMSNDLEYVEEYSNKSSIIVVESPNGLMAFIYDGLKDIFELEELQNVEKIESAHKLKDNKNVAFFVEKTELLEDIILSFKVDKNNFKELFLCPKES